MHQGPALTMGGNQPNSQQHDKNLMLIYNILRTEKKELGGIQLEMPKTNLNSIQKYEDVIQNWKPEEKVNFLETTLFKRKALKKRKKKSKNGIMKSKSTLDLTAGNLRKSR